MHHHQDKLRSAVFITFGGNCRKALTFYQCCFGGQLQFEDFGDKLPGAKELPVISGSLVSEQIIIHGSDLVHNEGRMLGNYIAIYLQFNNNADRKEFMAKVETGKQDVLTKMDDGTKLVELTDPFDVRWVLGI
jgi:PhnB protein